MEELQSNHVNVLFILDKNCFEPAEKLSIILCSHYQFSSASETYNYLEIDFYIQ